MYGTFWEPSFIQGQADHLASDVPSPAWLLGCEIQPVDFQPEANRQRMQENNN